MTFPSGAFKRYIVGQITATGDTEATTTVPVLEADSVVLFSLNTAGGTISAAPFVSTKNTTTKTIGLTAGSADTSVYDVIVLA